MNINKGREVWIDYLKAIAIFLIVFNHLVGNQFDFVFPQLSIFHIGVVGHLCLFWFASGYLYKKISVKQSVKKYFRRLIIPYLFFNFIGIFLGILIRFPQDFFNIIFSNRLFEYLNYKTLFGIFLLPTTQRNVFMNSPTWFLVSLFIILILFAILKRYTKNDKQIFICVFALQILNIVLNIFKVPSYLTINASIIGLLFFFIGYLFKKNDLKRYFENKKDYLRNIALIIVFAVITTILYKHRYFFWFFGGEFKGNPLFAYICAFSFLMAFVILTLMIKKENKLIYLISTNTLTIMCFDQYLRGFSKLVLKSIGLYSNMTVLGVFINACLIVLVATLFGMIMSKYTPSLVGVTRKNKQKTV